MFVRMTSHEVSEFNTGTEIFSAWFLFITILGAVGVMYYFTVVRLPPSPIFEKLFNLIRVPPGFEDKAKKGLEWSKHKGIELLSRVPPHMRKYIHLSLSGESELVPMKATEIEVNKVANASNNARMTSVDDPSACVIGAPLDDDDTETVPEHTVPKGTSVKGVNASPPGKGEVPLAPIDNLMEM